MALARKLFVNWHTRTRQRSDISASLDSVQTMGFLKGEQIPFEVCFVEPDPTGGPNSFTRVDITGLSLKMAINDTTDDATPLAENTSWTKDTSKNTFTGTLNLNTAAMNAYITGTVTAIFELELTDGTNRYKALSQTCNLALGVLQATTVAPDPLKVYLTADEQMGVFVPRAMENGASISLPSLSGAYRVILRCNDDGTFGSDVETT